jgi:hypothetical protein
MDRGHDGSVVTCFDEATSEIKEFLSSDVRVLASGAKPVVVVEAGTIPGSFTRAARN